MWSRRAAAEQLGLGITLGLLLATLCWHVALAAGLFWWFLGSVPLGRTDLIDLLGWDWGARASVILRNLYLALIAFTAVGTIAFCLWNLARLRQRPASALRGFVLCWWRTCLLGTLVIPGVLLFAWCLSGSSQPGLLVVGLYLLAAPAAISPRVLPTRLRWRPVCPECRHTVAYSVAPRCSECGAAYPHPARFYRRWAIERAPWDRSSRTLLFAYLQTICLILFRPCSAAWRLANPDHIGRAARWAAAHAALPLVLLSILYPMMVYAAPLIWPTAANPYPAGVVPADAQPVRIIWGVQWALAWSLAAVVYPVLVGLALSTAAPVASPAARLGMAKWSLYVGAAPFTALFALVIVVAVTLLAWSRWPLRVSIPWGISPAAAATVLLNVFILMYAVWWSLGIAAQPYLRRRGVVIFFLAMGAYLAVWQLTKMAFDLRGFEALL